MREEEYKRKKRRRFLLQTANILFAVLLIVAFGIWNFCVPFRALLPAHALTLREEGEMRLHFLDVGQGDCTIVEFPNGQILVADAGDGTWRNNNHITQYLKGMGAETLSLLMTHADADHCGGFSSLFECFSADVLYAPILPASTGIYREAMAAAEKASCPTRTLVRYDVITGGDAYAVCLSPHAADETEGNDSSTVLFLSYAGVEIVLGGDISSEREEEIFGEYELFGEIGEPLFDSGGYPVRLEETDILKVSHHGSGNSSSEDWIGLLSPKTAVISCGRGNAYGHPAEGALKELSDVGAEIFRTDELGDIMVTIRPDGTYRTEYGYWR